MRIHLTVAISMFLSIALSAAESPKESLLDLPREQTWQQPQPTDPAPNITDPAPPKSLHITDNFLGPEKCLEKKYSRKSCDRMFCPPWQRCHEEKCVCKLPYLCPYEGRLSVCGLNNRKYMSYCQVRTALLLLSIQRVEYTGVSKFSSSLNSEGVVLVSLPSQVVGQGELVFVCPRKWNIAAANVMCREQKHPLGAASVGEVDLLSVEYQGDLPTRCVEVHCQGYENSLAECHLHPTEIPQNGQVAMATCYQERVCESSEFLCVNSKCVSLENTCDGVDDCGDGSDEMCCKDCRSGFLCKPGVCVSPDAVRNNIRDCLDGKDEVQHTPNGQTVSRVQAVLCVSAEVQKDRLFLESKLHCGIPNSSMVDDVVSHDRGRVKRVIGGIPAKPTQIQWQVAIEERSRTDCAGAYIGGCWVLTAAHCVRRSPRDFRVKFSLWKKANPQGTTDIVPVKNIIIHPRFNASTYQDDIALIELERLPPHEDVCLEENPAISAVCVPWSKQLFSHTHTCSISGWGRTSANRGSNVLLWANVSLIENCEMYYKDRFKPGMMCAGDLDGRVDSCQGDSGGPLVCEDELGVSYLWGIVSWGAKCGEPGFPGVYTQVAHYFEWIRFHIGWPAVTKYNN
ncbi:unnamed protein product [Merluccius merluccius]